MSETAVSHNAPVIAVDAPRVVIYCRVSTDDSGQTNETQERECRRYCESQGYMVLDVYRDERTGSNTNRDEWSNMINRIVMHEDVDYIVAYDQSRVTRGEDYENIRAKLAMFRCRFKFVKLDLDDETLAGKITHSVMMHVNSEENKVRNEKTRLGMQTRKDNGIHVGRPAVFMFSEDIPTAPKGRYQPPNPEDGVRGTLTATENYIYSFAREGRSIYYVAKTILGISYHTLVEEMRPRDPSDPTGRNKGTKDRYSIYMELYNRARGTAQAQREGSTEERVGNPTETVEERVVG